MTNTWRSYECSTKFCSYVTTGMVFQIAIKCRGYSPIGGRILLWGNDFSLVTNSSRKLKMNICVLKLSILFPKNLVFLYYMQIVRFWFCWEKSIFHHLFYWFFLPRICPWFHDDTISYMITIYFFPKIEQATFTDQFHLLIFFLGSNLQLSKTKIAKSGNLCMKGKLKLCKI